MDRNAWTIITDNPVVVDFTGCRYISDIHNTLRDAFGFPAYYGKNWDAFWDCITDFFLGKGSWAIEVRGYDSLTQEFREYLKPMFEMFKEVEDTFPGITVSMTIK